MVNIVKRAPAAAAIVFLALPAFSGCGGGEGRQDAGTGDAQIDGAIDGSADASDAGDSGVIDAGADAGTCIYRPPVGQFSPKLLWEWTTSKTEPDSNQVIALPVVMNMTDDTGDGVIDPNDTPDVAFITFKMSDFSKPAKLGGFLRVISGDTGRDICINTDTPIAPETGLAGYIDAMGVPTIIASLPNHDMSPGQYGMLPSRLVAFQIIPIIDKEGKITGYACARKKNPDSSSWISSEEVNNGWGSASIVDIDHDGSPEILMAGSVFYEDGSLMWKGVAGNGGRSDKSTSALFLNFPGAISLPADVDGDGHVEIVAGNTVYYDDGSIDWQRKDLTDGLTAIADLDGDGRPEVVLVHLKFNGMYSTGLLNIVNAKTGGNICGPVDIPPVNAVHSNRGGAPVIADFDGDGVREIGIAGADLLTVFTPDCKVKWSKPIKDTSSSVTGCSVFDFEGDGKAEVVYNDERYLRVYSGPDGNVLVELPNTTSTTYEYPMVVDVNNDNKAEIVVIANAFCPVSPCDYPMNNGIRVFTDTLNNWVSTRNVWNQHTYHVTNVCSGLSDGFCPETDNFYGRIPKNEMSNWQSKTLDNYRQNVQGVSGFLAPDFIVAGYTLINIECPDSLGIRVSVRNIGDAPAGGGGGSQDQDGGTGDGGTDDGGTLPLTGVPVALYKGDPLSGGVAVGVGYTDRRMDPGGYATAVVWWYNAPAGEWPRSDLWIVVNDDGKGGRAYNECRTDNNYLHMPITYCKKEG